MSNDADNADKVGYKNPPRHSRFKPGQSGNPKGRKKGKETLADILKGELNRKMTIREGDQEIRITKQQALVKARLNAAIKGDRHAVNTILTLMARLIGMDEGGGQSMADLREEDKQILEQFMRGGQMA